MLKYLIAPLLILGLCSFAQANMSITWKASTQKNASGEVEGCLFLVEATSGTYKMNYSTYLPEVEPLPSSVTESQCRTKITGHLTSIDFVSRANDYFQRRATEDTVVISSVMIVDNAITENEITP